MLPPSLRARSATPTATAESPAAARNQCGSPIMADFCKKWRAIKTSIFLKSSAARDRHQLKGCGNRIPVGEFSFSRAIELCRLCGGDGLSDRFEALDGAFRPIIVFPLVYDESHILKQPMRTLRASRPMSAGTRVRRTTAFAAVPLEGSSIPNKSWDAARESRSRIRMLAYDGMAASPVLEVAGRSGV